MWFATEEERSEFETDLLQAFPTLVGKLRTERQQIAKISAGELVKIWFGKGTFADSLIINALLGDLRQRLRTRAALFSWVYGPGNSVARDLVYSKIPSSEKRRLVNLILACNHAKFPWLNSKIIHAMAFRPRAFDNAHPDNAMTEPWGPLYQRASIPKGRGKKRYLWIPNAPLKRVQKTLLRLVGPSIEHSLATCVYGASVGASAPTFCNAAAHLGKAFIASFDICDFFPSTRIHDILNGMQHLEHQSKSSHERLLMVDPARLPSFLRSSKQAQQIAWTHDAKILIARLGTRQGRLPQGSPLSPILANAAFAPYDTEILEILNTEFGKGDVKYTRYFDDLTISISKSSASRRHLESSSQVKLHCEELLNRALRKAPYRLQRRKNRCSSRGTPHEVTGLLVKGDCVDLNRRLKRHLRSTIHRLHGADFVEVAKTWYSANGQGDPVFRSTARGHRWQAVGLKRRRMSAERLATLMLRHIYPDLTLERLLPDWYPWQEILEQDDERVIKKRSAWKMIEWLLAATWSGKASLHTSASSGDNHVIFQQGSTAVCKVMAESSFDFFLLPKSSAIATVEYWHYLRGLAGYLGACPQGVEFSLIHKWCNKLRDAVEVIQITAASTTRAQQTDGDSPDTLGSRIKDCLPRVLAEYNQFARWIHCANDESLGTRQDRFRRDVDDKTSFEDWIAVVSELFVHRLPRLPEDPGFGKNPLSSKDFFEYLRVKYYQLKNQCSQNYHIIDKVEELFGLRKKVTTNTYLIAQYFVLNELLRHFASTTRRRHECEGSEAAWYDELLENNWHRGLPQQLEYEFVRLEKLYHKLRSTEADAHLFVRTGGEAFVSKRSEFTWCEILATSDQMWDHLFSFAKALHSVLYEDLDPSRWPSEPTDEEKEIIVKNNSTVRGWKRRQLWKNLEPKECPELKTCLTLIELMRNREAHGKSPERREDWVKIQDRVSKLLGRKWSSKAGRKHPDYHADCDLVLYAYEGIVVKIRLLEAAGTWLKDVEKERKWENLGASDR